MRYPIMTTADATAYLAGRRSGSPPALEPLIKPRGDGPEMAQDFVSALRADMEAIKARYRDGLKNNADENTFEARAARAIHVRLQVDAVILADADFWRWLAVAHFADLVEWRYGSPEGGTGLANYGVGAKSENLLYRLWLRAELVLDDAEGDRYHLCDRGQIDFYRSHLFRQGYANARAFARALLRYQYPEPLQATQPTLKVAEIRELVKRLRRMRTNLFVEILNEDECRQIIEEEAVRVLGPE
jgi:hypothetical protein